MTKLRSRDFWSGWVSTTVVENCRKNVLQAGVKKHIAAGSALCTDAQASDQGLK
jgi:hypothetical protein